MAQSPDVSDPGGPGRPGLGEPDSGACGHESPDADRQTLASLGVDVSEVEAEERAAAQRLSSIAAGRRMGGVLGAAAAGAMLGLRDIYEGPPKDDGQVSVAESPGDPGDIDTDGIGGRVDDVDFWAPPPGRAEDS